MTLLELVTDRSVIICAGSGGVGKTTTAAVVALEAARRGRRACVVTIDPARRLADALGLEGLTNSPARIEGAWPGELWAMMLDPKKTFDELVASQAADADQVERILQNRFYRNISGALSGTQEYMATEKLYELHSDERFDLVVVDTPPTRHALDFLDAPRRLSNFLKNPIFRALMGPTKVYLRAVGFAAQALLKTVAKVVGAEVVEDAVTFFRAFEGMEDGFLERARHVQALLVDPATAYVLVTSPRRDTIEEATYFAQRLRALDLQVSGLIVNRMHPTFGQGGFEEARRRAATAAGTPIEPFLVNMAQFRGAAAREEEHLAGLAADVAPAPVARVPILEGDVHDLGGLSEVAEHLFARG